jgi:predicted Zn finger-like uncharacterized protein
MNIQCENCSRKFIVKDSDIPKNGRTVQCGYCSVTWLQMPISKPAEQSIPTKKILSSPVDDESPSVDKIKASDGKNYKFLGSQWAELLPSGKTGLFARKKISKELDEITGRKEKKIKKRRSKKIEEVNPSSDSLDSEKNILNDNLPKGGLGFLGYIFLLIIVAFSLVGILKTFERDLLNRLPEMEYIFTLLNEQLKYLSESVKNFIVIIDDLINFY